LVPWWPIFVWVIGLKQKKRPSALFLLELLYDYGEEGVVVEDGASIKED